MLAAAGHHIRLPPLELCLVYFVAASYAEGLQGAPIEGPLPFTVGHGPSLWSKHSSKTHRNPVCLIVFLWLLQLPSAARADNVWRCLDGAVW